MVKNSWLPTCLLMAIVGLASLNIYSNPTEAGLDGIAAKILQYSQKAEGTVLTETGAADLNIIKGKRQHDITLFSKVDRTKTELGAETLKHLLVNPLNDAAKIRSRQAFVRKLKGNAELLREIDSNIDQIKANEQNLFKFCSDSHKLGTDFLGLSTQLVGANNSKIMTELTRASAFGGISILGALGTVGSFVYGCKLGGSIFNRLDQIFNMSGRGRFAQWGNEDQDFDSDRVRNARFSLNDGIALAASLALTALVKYRLAPAFSNQSKVSAQMLELLSSVNAILRASENLSELLEMDEATKALSYVQNLKIYTRSFEGLSEEVTSLIKELQTSTFVNNKSIVSFVGRIRVAYGKFNELKNSFKDLFKAIGEVDAFASFARLIKEHEDQATKFCFVEYITADKPVIEFKDGWCTTIASDIVVSQTLNLGAKKDEKSEELYCPNVYLTAANGAGKSTLLILTGDNTILSQVVGVAAASSWKTTLFDAIVTHVNIDHNTKEGQSSYMVEQEVMEKLKVDIMKKFNNKKVVLAVIDEPYKSTEVGLGCELLSDFVDAIQFYPKSICLIASHLLQPALKIKEENKGRFINLCIPTKETPEGSGIFSRDHKIDLGIDPWVQGVDRAKNLRYDAFLKNAKIDPQA